MMQKLYKFLAKFFEGRCVPDQEEMARNVILGVAALGLQKDEKAYLAPINGVCGPITITGNSLPVFKYIVFEKTIKQFLLVTVEISKPARIHYSGVIQSEVINPESHGKSHPVSDKYKAPFQQILKHITGYFPLCRHPL